MSDGVSFGAAVYKVQTLVDGGLRVTLDLPEDAIVQAAWLMECKRQGVALQVMAEPCITEREQGRGKEQDDISAGPKRQSRWKAT